MSLDSPQSCLTWGSTTKKMTLLSMKAPLEGVQGQEYSWEWVKQKVAPFSVTSPVPYRISCFSVVAGLCTNPEMSLGNAFIFIDVTWGIAVNLSPRLRSKVLSAKMLRNYFKMSFEAFLVGTAGMCVCVTSSNTMSTNTSWVTVDDNAADKMF